MGKTINESIQKLLMHKWKCISNFLFFAVTKQRLCSHRGKERKEADVMAEKFKRQCKPTTLLLVIGFTISLMAVLVGISTINALLEELTNAESDMPILQTMQNTGITLSLSVYLFSVINSFVVSNYWIITRQREFAIRKAFGWTNGQLLRLICKEMTKILLVSLCAGAILLGLFAQMGAAALSIKITPFFALETILLLEITLILAILIPAARIAKIEPAEVIS